MVEGPVQHSLTVTSPENPGGQLPDRHRAIDVGHNLQVDVRDRVDSRPHVINVAGLGL